MDGKDHGPGIISVSSYFLGRYREFDKSLNMTLRPKGTDVDMQLGVNIAWNFNKSIQRMLDGDFKWIWFLGDDHVWSPELLKNLLDRNVDVVSPLVTRRAYPFGVILKKSRKENFAPLSWEWLKGKTGLVDASDLSFGNAGLLVRRSVLEGIKSPWYAIGRFHPELNAPDLYFCELLREHKTKMWLDTDNSIGHITHGAAFPVRCSDGSYEAEMRYPTDTSPE
jgi:hypothetical protein